jgi:hypothetical protein
MKKISQALLFVLFSVASFSQQATDSIKTEVADTTFSLKDTINQNRKFSRDETGYRFSGKAYAYNKKRVTLVAAGNIAGYGGSMAALYKSWYSQYPQSNFHTFDDNREWKQIDKFGHAYAAYIESYGSMEMWRWSGLKNTTDIKLTGTMGASWYHRMIKM